MDQAQKNLIFSIFVITLLSVCILGLVVFQFTMPVSQTATLAKIDYRQMQSSNEMAAENEGLVLKVTPDLYRVENLTLAFDKIGYDLDKILSNTKPVPAIILERLPRDLDQIKVIKDRKDLFFKTLLPIVLKVNGENLKKRARVFRLTHRMRLNQSIHAKDRLWLETQFSRYGLQSGDLKGLLLKIDAIPPSLALAQAAEESGWGTSRFVRDGNALFGQWTFNTNDKGIIPKKRGADQTHRIKAFDTLSASLRAYMFNLNSHNAYEDFRKKRAELRRNPSELTGLRLASSLTKYSERGEKYVELIQTLIRQNTLKRFDQARLSKEAEIDYETLINPAPPAKS